MKLSLKYYGIFILLGVISNVIIFYFLSTQLKEFVFHKTVEKYSSTKIEKVNSSVPRQSPTPF